MRDRLTLFLTLVFFITACNKNKDNAETVSTNNVSLVNTEALPGQIVVAQANFTPNLSAGNTILVNGAAVTVYTNDSNQVIFVMPVLPAGTATINFAPIGADKRSDITIKPYTAITKPADVQAAFSSKIDAVVAAFQAQVNNPVIHFNAGYNDVLKYLQKTIADNFNSLTTAQQTELAYFLQNNMPDPSQFVLDELNSAHYQRQEALTFDPSLRLLTVATGFRNSVTKTIAFLGIGVGLSYIPSPDLLTKLMAFGSFVAGGVYLMDALSKVEEIAGLKGLIEKLLDLGNRIESLELNLYKDVAKNVSFRASYRNLIIADGGSSNTIIADVFKAEKSFGKLYTDVLTAYNKVKAWFLGAGPSLPSYSNPIKTAASYITYPMAGSKLQIKNVSDAAIQVSATANDTTLTLKATSSTLTADRAFTFDAVYTDVQLGISITQKINAVFKPALAGVTVAGGNGIGTGANQIPGPRGIWLDKDGSLLIADYGNGRVQKWAKGATTGTTVVADYGIGVWDRHLQPNSVAGDNDGNVYVLNVEYPAALEKFAPGATQPVRVLGTETSGSAYNQLSGASDIWRDASGSIYVMDASNSRVQKWTPGVTGAVTIVGTTVGGYVSAICGDNKGALYLFELDNYKILKWTAATGLTVFAGNKGLGSTTSHPGAVYSMCVDKNGNLYTADQYNHRVQKWTAGSDVGVVVAGGNGKGSAANQLDTPSGVVVDDEGYIYISDKFNNRVQRWAQ
ncbi:MAG: NHL repeat-containing protein [Chitinophagaceae bacterium]